MHLQADRSLELHNQGGTHTRVRLPRFGRALAYHFPSADALVGASGTEIYRLNLAQGRYLAPYTLGSQGHLVTGCNAIDVNPAHGLLSFGTEGAGIVELWDPRMRRQAGSLSIATQTVLDAALLMARRQMPGISLSSDANEDMVAEASSSLAITALASAADGLNLAVGTNTGHILLYDLRMDKPYTSKDQGFGMPIKSLSWPGDANESAMYRTRSEAEGKVMSADAKVIKIWDKQTGDNLVSVAPAGPLTNLNHVQHYPGSGLLFAAVEATQMAAWYVPALGPAPKWCSFIDNITDEIEVADTANTGGAANAYEDFKFVDQAELERLDLGHLVGTPLLRPYMHGYFLSLKLYERARLLAHPTAFEEAKQRAIQSRLEREAESRVRSVKNARKLGSHIQVNRQLAEKLSTATTEGSEGLLQDARFKELFTNPEFQVDETSREYALLHPSESLKERPAPRETQRPLVPAMEEEQESDVESLDPDQEEESESASEESDHEPPAKQPKQVPRVHTPRVVESFDSAFDDEDEASTQHMSLGDRARQWRPREKGEDGDIGGGTISWTPSGKPSEPSAKKPKKAREETFGMGLSKGAGADEGYGVDALSEQARFGRKERRKPTRSASKNAMRAHSQ